MAHDRTKDAIGKGQADAVARGRVTQQEMLAKAKASAGDGTDPLGGGVLVRGKVPDAVQVFTDATDALLPYDKALLEELALTHECEKLLVLKEKQAVRGIVLGEGPTVTMEDLTTHEDKDVKTWRLRVSRALVVRLLGSYQLDQELPMLTGAEIVIAHNGQVQTRAGKRVNDLTIFKPRGFLEGVGKPAAVAATNGTVIDVPAAEGSDSAAE
jgi:hypothetical protein